MLTLTDISKVYRTTEVETLALNGVSLAIEAGEFVAIMGPSGCGKSTLMNVLGLLDSPTSGSYAFFGEEVAGHSEARLTRLRREAIGFVFQSFNLIDDLSVAENVEVALLYRGVAAAEEIASLVAPELGWDEERIAGEIRAYKNLVAARLRGETAHDDATAAAALAAADADAAPTP